MKTKKIISLALAASLALSSVSYAAEEVGTIAQLRGKALIQRAQALNEVKVKDAVQLQDILETKQGSRAKVVFIDESMLTLAPDSRASIKQFVYSRAGGGTSIFNLLDGKMRAVVGKNKFEVHTATTVAAARGTIIEFSVGVKDGVPFTTITCIEGVVSVKSTDPSVMETVDLKAGETITVVQSMPLSEPAPTPLELGYTEEKKETTEVEEAMTIGPAVIAPPIQQEPSTSSNVSITIGFP